MKKNIFTFAIALLAVTSLTAQEFNVGTNVINVGVGFGGSHGYSGYYIGYSSSPSESPVFSASYERGVWEVGPGVISLGGYLGHRTYKYSGSDNNWKQTVAGVRAAYHYTGFDVENLDVYGGLMAGYYFYSNNYNDGRNLNHSGFVGGRWYFTDAIAVYAEAGYGIANFSAGVAFRF